MILQSYNGSEFVNEILTDMKKLWPDCVIVTGRPLNPQSNGGVERSNADVESMIGAWIRDKNSTQWSLGIHEVAAQKNDIVHSTDGKTPYMLQYGQDKRVGLAASKLPANIIRTLRTEEDLDKEDSDEPQS